MQRFNVISANLIFIGWDYAYFDSEDHHSSSFEKYFWINIASMLVLIVSYSSA